jgi:hypothetical protein
MSGRGDEIDAEPSGIEDDIAEGVDLDLTTVAPPGADLAETQRATQQPAQLLSEGLDVRCATTSNE